MPFIHSKVVRNEKEDKDSRMETGGMWGERETEGYGGDVSRCFIYVVYVKVDTKETKKGSIIK